VRASSGKVESSAALKLSDVGLLAVDDDEAAVAVDAPSVAVVERFASRNISADV
jgi:hypothetical protein